jgi:hypothetical protein
MPSKDYNAMLLPVGDLHMGPAKTAPIPAPLPAGVLPEETSKMWKFVPAAIQMGEKFIQEDTRAWFAEREFKVQVARAYPDHPRWQVQRKHSKQMHTNNEEIVSEVHMLVRLHNGLPEYPDWVNARVVVKTVQSDLAYRFAKALRTDFLKGGMEAIETLRQRSPGQYLRLVENHIKAKNVQPETADGLGLDKDERSMLLKALADELKRRQQEAEMAATVDVMDYEPVHDAREVMQDTMVRMSEAAAEGCVGQALPTRGPRMEMTWNLGKVENILDTYVEEEPEKPKSQFDWED